VLARQGAAGRSHPVEHAGVGPRIGNIHTAAQDDDGDSTGVQGAAMGGRVDADSSLARWIVLLPWADREARRDRDVLTHRG
jgi:hypothetical protein